MSFEFAKRGICKTLLCKLLLFSAPLLAALTPQEFQQAKATWYRNYAQVEAHFRFAGILYDAGLYESAFFNTRNLRANTTLAFFEKSFAANTRRKLREYPMPKPPKQASGDEKIARARNALQQLAAKHPELAAYCIFAAANESAWNSTAPGDIERIAAGLLNFRKVPQIWEALFFNSVAARYFHKIADDPEKALYFYLKLYFHDPSMNIGEPVDYCIVMLYRRVADIRMERTFRAGNQDYRRTIADNLDLRPRSVQELLQRHKKFIPPPQFAQLCLLASASVDIQLRSYSLEELAGSNANYFHSRLQELLTAKDAAVRAAAITLLPKIADRKELYKILAGFTDDPDDIVTLTIDAMVRKYCDEKDQQRFRRLTGRKE